MSAKTDVEAIRLIGDEVVRLLMLPEEKLENEAREGLQLIAELARWRDSAFGPDPSAGMHFEVFTCGVDETRPLLYLWQIEDRHGQILYRYVGKSERGSRRPLTQYRRNVENYLAGKPYRKGKPSAFREVHLRMSDAIASNQKIALYLLENVDDVASIFVAERAERDRYCATPYCDLPSARRIDPRRLA